jgi:hypothetical protein
MWHRTDTLVCAVRLAATSITRYGAVTMICPDIAGWCIVQ